MGIEKETLVGGWTLKNPKKSILITQRLFLLPSITESTGIWKNRPGRRLVLFSLLSSLGSFEGCFKAGMGSWVVHGELAVLGKTI